MQQQLAIAEHYTRAKLNFTDPALQKVFDDSMDFSTVLNTERIDPSQIMVDDKIRPRLRGTSWQEILISVLYRLLDAYPLDDESPLGVIDSAIHAGLICLMTTMMIRGSPLHHQYYKLLRRRMFNALAALGNADSELKFWLCFVGGASVFDTEADWKWLGTQITRLSSRLGLTTLKDARLVLMKFPWVRYFHDEASGSVFWNALGTWQRSSPELEKYIYWPNSLNKLKPYLAKDSPD